MKKLLLLLIFLLVLIQFGCTADDPEVECVTYFDCAQGQVCVEGRCVEDEGGFPDNSGQPDNSNPVDNEQPDTNTNDNSLPDTSGDDSDETGGSQCSKDTDCEDDDPCTDNKCESGYCFFPTKKEICNGVDDNCNDKIDETFEGMDEACDTGFEGECAAGKMACVDGNEVCLSPFHTETELCNGKDDNCDGKVDVFKPEEAPDCPLTLGICAAAKKQCNGTDWVECTTDNYGPDYSETDMMDDNFMDVNCDGVDGMREDHIYVDGANGDDDLNDGSYENPVKTINKGLELAGINGKKSVVVAKGVYEETVALADGISIYGGFSGSPDWDGAAENETIISGGEIGVIGEEVSNINLYNLTIMSADREAGEGSSYAVFLYKVTSMIINNSVIIGGHGADGTNGADGADGADGNVGGKGDEGCEDGDFVTCFSSCSRPDGGVGGKNPGCGMNGGNGGQPGKTDSSGSAGSPGANGGGTGGLGGIHETSDNECKSTSISAIYSKGGDGSNGGDGNDAPAVVLADFTQEGFIPKSPNNGEDGVHGRGGGGGGGGHGGCGGWGGDGGNGGKGGTGAGGAGGPSYGIYSINGAIFAEATVTFDVAPGGTGGSSTVNPGPDGPSKAGEM